MWCRKLGALRTPRHRPVGSCINPTRLKRGMCGWWSYITIHKSRGFGLIRLYFFWWPNVCFLHLFLLLFPCTFPCHPVSNSKIDPSWLRLLRGLDGYMRSKLTWSFVFVPWSLHSHIGWKDRKNKGMFMLHAIHWQWKMMFITVHMMFMFFFSRACTIR